MGDDHGQAGVRRRLPDGFLRGLAKLERSYLMEDDPIRQSGFGGGAERWRAEREPILDAVTSDGDFLDACCANGYLLECLVAWGRGRGRRLVPWGLDHGAGLVALARRRLAEFASDFFVGNAWEWEPPRRFRYVYTLLDCVPGDFRIEYVRRLLGRFVTPGGRLIVGDYGSRSRGRPPLDVTGVLRSAGLAVAGTSAGGSPAITAFAWAERCGEDTQGGLCSE